MFTGIIETIGKVIDISTEGSLTNFDLSSTLGAELKIDQSLAHNGVCLTVTKIEADVHRVTAVNETLIKTTLSDWKIGASVNLERCIRADARFDGHFVQGHVDNLTQCIEVLNQNGSWYFSFAYSKEHVGLLVPQGSVTVNGVSLTIARLLDDNFTVAVIPYTYENTTFGHLTEGDMVNIEYDIFGKYILRNIRHRAIFNNQVNLSN